MPSEDRAQQRNMIGERLYPLIHATQPALAGKVSEVMSCGE